jgi:glycosyltransferase involved in cell wall biosynthesis
LEENLNKKILIVTEYFYPEEFKINEIAVAWRDKGYDVDILTQNPTYPLGKIFDGYANRWFTKDTYEGMTVYRVKAVTGYKTSLFKKLLKYFAFMVLGSFISLKIGRKYDYVFGFDVGALTGMVPAVVVGKFYKTPVVLWIQDVWPDSVYAYGFKKQKVLEYLLNAFVRFVYKNSSALAVSGEGFLEKVEPFVEKDKIVKYLPNWADEFRESDEVFSFSELKKIHFTFAGNVGTVQNLDNIIESFGMLENSLIEQAQLNIIGDGSHLEALKNLVKVKKIPNVVFWGRKPRDEMLKYFKGSDFLIVSLIDKPIFSLTVPAKTQTYIAVKKPILAILNGDTAKIIEDNKLGFTAKPDDLEAIKNIFSKSILLREDEKLIFTTNAEKLTITVFNKEKIIDELLELLLNGEKK